MRWLVLILGALLVVPTASLSLVSPVAFAQGEQDQSPDVGPDASATATPAPEVQASVTPSPSATPSETAPSGTPSASATTSPDESAAPTPGGDESSTPAGPRSGSTPTIASDLADYPPGGTVTLNGAGWQVGEVVTIVVNDTGGLSWKLTKDVLADADGRIALTFALPNYYVPDYDVTATGPLSGVAKSTFTDAANGDWQYWMTAPAPAAGNISPGATITYVLNAQKTTWSPTAVTGAVMTLTLSGSATFTSFGSIDGDDGTVTITGPKTVTWNGMRLNGTWPNYTTRTVTVTATVAASATAGTVVATTGDTGDPNGDPYGGSGSYQLTTHNVTPPTVGDCSFATPGTGAFSKSICWFDLAGYNPTTAATTGGQRMQQNLLNGYVLSYTVTVKDLTNADVYAKELPTYEAAYLGNHGFYAGIKGKPALYQRTTGSLTTLALTGISLKDGAGNTVTGFALVGADAESTHNSEYITWTSDKAITSAATATDLGNACGGGFTGVGTKSVTCTGDGSGTKTGAAILYSQDPGTFTQTMKGAGLQAVAFGVMVSGLQLNKQVVNQLPGDQFRISVARSDMTVAATAITDPVTGSAATEQVYTISSGSSQAFTLSEEPLGNTSPANYATTWECTKNGAVFTPTGTSATVAVTLNDFVACTITNTAPTLTLAKRVNSTAGGNLTPANWTLAATGSAASISQSPVPPWTVSGGGTMTTGSTATTALPVGAYTLGESSTTTGANRYAAGSWACTNSGAAMTLNGNIVTLAAGSKVTCTITNTYVAGLIMTKTWIDGVNGDKTDLVINGATSSPGKVTSTSNGSSGSWADATNVARATPAMGSTVSVTEVMQSANRGTYTRVLTCLAGANPVTVVNGVFTMPRGDVTCAYTNKSIVGTVTWSKVDAGSLSTLLRGSEWTLTGPSYPSPGTTITDCASAPCAGPDTDPIAGQFSVPVLYGTHTLLEKTAPFGFQTEKKERIFDITTDGQVLGLGAFANKRVVVPAIPLTGGFSADSYLSSGITLLLLAGLAAWHQRRRRIPHPRA